MRWDQASFDAQVKQAANTTRKQFGSAANDIGVALKRGIGTGFDAAKKSLGGLGGQIKSVIGTAATLGGAVSIGAFATDALHANEAAGALASKLRIMGDAGASAQGVLAMTRREAERLNVAAGDVRAAYEEMLTATGDRQFAAAGIDAAAQFQKVWRLSATDSAKLVSMFKEKLGATTDEIQNDLGPALLDMTSRGGLGIQDLLNGGNSLLALLPAIGAKGAGGLGKLVGLLNMTDDAGGEAGERMGQLQQVLVRFKDPDVLKAIGKELNGMKFDEKADAVENFQKVLAAKGGEQALGKLLGGGRTAVIFKNLMQPFTEAKEEALSRGATAAKAAQAGAAAFDRALAEQSKTSMTKADMDREAAARSEEAGERMRVAISRMSEAFTSPKILGAAEKLAEKLPAMAEAFVKAFDMVVEHPILASAAVVGAQGAAAAALPLTTSLLKSWLMPGKPRGIADAAAGAMGGNSMTVAHMTVGSMSVDPLAAAGKDAAKSLTGGAAAAGTGWRADARAAGLNFSTAVGVAAAALAGWQIGTQISEQIVEPAISEDIGARGASRTAMVEDEARRSMRNGTADDMRKSLDRVRQERKTIREGSVFTDVAGTAAAMFTGAKAPPAMRIERESQMIDVQADLELALKRRIALEQRINAAGTETAKTLELTAKAARGVRRPAAPMPGSERAQ